MLPAKQVGPRAGSTGYFKARDRQSRLVVKEKDVLTNPWFVSIVVSGVYFLTLLILLYRNIRKTKKAALQFLEGAYRGIVHEAATEKAKGKSYESKPSIARPRRISIGRLASN